MPPRAWIFFTLLCVFESTADVLAKQHVARGSVWLAAGAVFSYLLGNTAWIFALRSGAMLGVGAVLFGILTGVSATVVGVLIYHEGVSRLQTVGLPLGVISMALLAAGGNKS